MTERRGRGRPPKGSEPPDIDLPDLLSYWNRAVSTPFGIKIASQKPEVLAARLYAARRAVGGFVHMKIVTEEDKVWIVPR